MHRRSQFLWGRFLNIAMLSPYQYHTSELMNYHPLYYQNMVALQHGMIWIIMFWIPFSNEEIPDPVEILSRVAALEASIASLQKECNELVQLRAVLAGETTSLLLKNYTAIQEVCTSMHIINILPANENYWVFSSFWETTWVRHLLHTSLSF